MTATATQSRARSQRRIIERPRLIKLLDESEARTILLIAPAGYGKTTLARQWARTLNGAIWVTLTPAHRDVAWLAEDVADAFSDEDVLREARAHIRAQTNPQLVAAELGRVLANRVRQRAQWIFFDDYHEIASSADAEDFISSFERHGRMRVVVTSRTRPGWASARRLLYVDVAEISRDELAMTGDEVTEMLGRSGDGGQLLAQAEGWPAVIGLASTLNPNEIPDTALPSALHGYLAEELFARAPSEVQEAWLTLALLDDQTPELLQERFGAAAVGIVRTSTELGFNARDGGFGLHPLLREFLLQKLAREKTAETRVRDAVGHHVRQEAWDKALDLVLRFQLDDLIEPTLERAFKPLVRSGRVETLAQFARQVAADRETLPPTVEVALAEAAMRDGELELAKEFANRGLNTLGEEHELSSRAATIAGRAAFLLADFDDAGVSFGQAQKSARDSADAMEAVHGLASASVFGEHPSARAAIRDLGEFASYSATHFLRFASIHLDFKRIGGSANGLTLPLGLEEGREAHSRSEDPRARTAFAYAAAGALNFRGEYEAAREWLARLFEDIETFGLEFVLPFAYWALAQSALGARRFGEAERALQMIEDAAVRTHDRQHEMNAAVLRGRLFLQTGDADAAVRSLRADPEFAAIPSWRAEFFATRALALACQGHAKAALGDAGVAEALTAALDVELLVRAARTIAMGATDEGCAGLISRANRTWVWDPVICALRSSSDLASSAAANPVTRDSLASLYERTGDSSLAKKAGLRTRATRAPDAILTSRELEVLGLIARGFKNKDISRALYIADSTTKVHVRHILEKLGVRTRAEAVARYQMLRDPGD